MNILRSSRFSLILFFSLLIAACGPKSTATIYETVSPASIKPGSDVPAPTGDVVLTVDGKISQKNSEDSLQFDMDTLESLGVVQYDVDDPFAKKSILYAGVLLSDLLKVAGVSSDATTLTLRALDDYSTDMKIADAYKWPVLIATRADGAYMPIDNSGPLISVFPFNDFPEIDHLTYDAQWLWSLAGDHGQVSSNNKAAPLMTKRQSPHITLWMLSPLELFAIFAVVLLTTGGLFFSLEDAYQLEQAINLDLTESVITNQGIVNLQRDVLLTHNEILQILANPETPIRIITRFDFVQIQVNNLANQVPSEKSVFAAEDLALVGDIQAQTAAIEKSITDWEQSKTTEEGRPLLQTMEPRLAELEASIKQLIDRQAIAQRDAIIQTRDSLNSSQHTTLLAGTVLLLVSFALAVVFRHTLTLRLHQAVEADRLKSQLLANVSHELRTPINAIQGYSQLLNEAAYGSLTEKQQTTIQRIIINTTQLKGMVNNLLDRAQIEQGKITLRHDPFAPAELIETTRAALNILAETKKLELTSDIMPNVPARLTGDFLRLQQILFNLVSNAIKFTETGGVQMRILVPDPAHWALQVIDTGIGISPETQGQVFEAFWQIDGSATRQYRGSGLGLSIVKELAELMGGRITLTSEPDKGSTFNILFPLESPA